MVSPGQLPWAAARQLKKRLEEAGCPDPDFDARYLVELVTGRPARFDQTPLDGQQAQRLEQLAEKRCQRVPLQYLSQEWDFLNVTLRVGEGVLCPRPDTEVVCLAAAEKAALFEAPRVLDLCAGTGCLGIGVKSLAPKAQVTCLEKSPQAMEYLRENCRRYGVKCRQGDLFGWEKDQGEETLELLTANPPYLTSAEMKQLQPEVAFEPAMALEAGEDGLVFYRYLVEYYQKCLVPGGWLVLEIGWQQGKALADLLKAAHWQQVEIRKDYGGNDRVAIAQRPLAPHP